MNKSEAIERAARELENLARKLRLQVRPGHVEYVSKGSAAAIVEGIITELLTDGRRQAETMNGQPIFVSHDESTLFIPIPADLAAPVTGGCQCDYCKAHRDVPARWDAIALRAKPKNTEGEHVWTVHLPDRGGLRMYGWRKP